ATKVEANEKHQRQIAEAAAKQAKAQAQIAESRRLATLSENEPYEHLDRALILAGEAYDAANTLEARDSLFRALHARPRLLTSLGPDGSTATAVAFSPDGTTLAVGYSADNPDNRSGVVLFDATRRERLHAEPLVVPERVRAMAFSPDGTTLAVGY